MNIFNRIMNNVWTYLVLCLMGFTAFGVELHLQDNFVKSHPLSFTVIDQAGPVIERRSYKGGSELITNNWIRIKYDSTNAIHDFALQNPFYAKSFALNGNYTWSKPSMRDYDSARKGDIDIEGLRSARKAECAAEYDAVYAALGQYMTPEFLTWEKMVAKHNENYNTAREEYGAQELVVKAKEYGKSIENHWFDIDSYCMDRDTYLALKEISGFSTFAILKDGQWSERGKMHMFGAVSEEDSHWEFQFEKIFKEVPDDHWVTIVDCHI